MGQRRAPGVQDGGEPDARAQMLGVGGDRRQRLGGGAEQEIVDGGLVLERDLGDRRRQGEDDVVIGDRQQFGLALGEPLPRRRALTLRAMPIAAGVVGDAFMRAVLAALDVSAERGSATGFDRRHDLQLREAHMAGVGLAPCGPVGAKDVGDLQKRPRHAASVGGRRWLHRLEAELVERAGDDADRVDGDAGVERRRLQLGVAQQNLDDPDIDALFEQVGGEAMAQGVRRHALVDPGLARRGAERRGANGARSWD